MVALGALLDELGVAYELSPQGSLVVVLPGTHKLKTTVNLIPGEHSVRIEAFVVRHPDENHEAVWAWLLRKNARMYGVSFSIDGNGDIYLTGRLPNHAVTTEELDRLLGAVLSYADESFDALLELGFAEAIRREWAWRISRGEPTENLRAFRHLAPESAQPDHLQE
ncbi:MAG: YbjN domain-containing protein [Hamadaea sp.]|uniref:YbjN domain-containing protein n=1 Tax=Hamadaea sp. TaxID=2024425 RepID=UPI0017EF88AB|nr:YbjN domain-containing protein [Hamadaea sp.]NUR70596.1 YbjN domain-containing protein [Hamadaea sp.]NUT19275.1 YbjN domain-containing protein [Hamadaea sp.]